VGEDERLEGVVVRGSLIAGLTTSTELSDEGSEKFSGVGRSEASRETSEVGQETEGER
jgi:hypothetical protein